MMKTTFLAVFCYLLCTFALAQDTTTTQQAPPLPQKKAGPPSHSAALIRVDYAFQLPLGDMAERFGANSCLGVGVDYKTANNWLIGIEGRYLFGESVHEDSLAINLATTEGYIIGESGLPANVNIQERGWWGGIKLGRIFALSPKRPDSGILATVGIGYLQHYIRLQDLQNEIPQFLGEYVKGYDRLTGGLSFSQSIGYIHLPNKGLRFFAAIDITEAFTQSLRDYQFDTQTSDTKQRLDLLLGFRLGWILPLYTGAAQKDGTKIKEKRYYID